MTDPLTEIVTLLQPTARFSKRLEAAGHWRIEREGQGDPFYAAVLEGQCQLSVDGAPPVILQAGDFVLAPAVHTLVNTSLHAPAATAASLPVHLGENRFRIGSAERPPELQMQIGHCQFGSPDAALLVPLLPQLVRVSGQARLATLVQMVGEESRAQRPGRDVVLERLLEVLLIEALRSQSGPADGGLVRGLADDRLAAALRCMHARPDHGWSVASLAQQAALSRSAFAARFMRVLGIAPMEYLLAWRMALAKRLLRSGGLGLQQVAERVGYASAETFSVAFARHAGLSPARFLRGH